MKRSPRASVLAAVIAVALMAAPAVAQVVLDPLSLEKYVDPVPVPGVLTGQTYYEVGAYQIQQKLHRDLPPTTVYGYGTSQATASYPGPTFVVQKGVPIQIKWTNNLPSPHILAYAFDPTLPAAHTTTGIPIATHVHGAEVEPQSDGGPMTWFTPGFAEVGHDWTKEVLSYANTQLPATIWYHDHAFGYTRHNVYAGLAGFYLVTDPGNEPPGLPAAPYDLGLAIQDRMFTTDGQLWYPNEGETDVHPVWIPEFFGNVMLVNGKVWPYLNVEPRKYRLRFLNGSQARFYSLALQEPVTSTPGPAFWQIGTDGGYLAEPVLLNDPADMHSPRLLMAPGERADVIIDFSAYAPGTEFILKNTGKAPFPSGEAPDPQTVGQIMKFRVGPPAEPDLSVIPSQLATVTRLSNPIRTRTMTLNEVMDEDGPIAALLNGMPFHDVPITEYPELGTTEMWEIVNMTGDSHPIHIHLVQFQLLNRQRYNVKKYENAFMAANPVMPAESYTEVPVAPYLKGKPIPADPNERGWKDTFRMNPGDVTRVLIRFAPQDESPAFVFDATAEPGYVWHCHILEHEENDMMRPYMLVPPTPATLAAQSAAATVEWQGQASPVTALRAPAPNPVVDGSNVTFTLRNAGNVELDVYTVNGRLVSRVASGWYEAGEHTVAWQRRGASGEPLANGVYIVRFQSGDIERSHKLVLVR